LAVFVGFLAVLPRINALAWRSPAIEETGESSMRPLQTSEALYACDPQAASQLLMPTTKGLIEQAKCKIYNRKNIVCKGYIQV
jgi:hypothetical protein